MKYKIILTINSFENEYDMQGYFGIFLKKIEERHPQNLIWFPYFDADFTHDASQDDNIKKTFSKILPKNQILAPSYRYLFEFEFIILNNSQEYINLLTPLELINFQEKAKNILKRTNKQLYNKYIGG